MSILIPLAATALAFSGLGWWLHRAYAALRSRPATAGTRTHDRSRSGRPGARSAFVPQHVIVTAACLGLGGAAGVLAFLAPAVWLPIGAGIAVTGPALAFYALWHGRHRP